MGDKLHDHFWLGVVAGVALALAGLVLGLLVLAPGPLGAADDNRHIGPGLSVEHRKLLDNP